MRELQQNTAEWLEFRRSKIGSSDAPIIMGKSPWKNPHQLWEEKAGLRTASFESRAMQRGQQLEPEARKLFELKTGLVVWPDVLIHPSHNFMIASLDGITMDGKTAVEIKCPGAKTHQMALDGEIPEHYRIQMQHQMMVAGLDTMFYFSYDGTNGVTLKVARDQALIDDLAGHEIEFHRFMTKGVSPAHPCENDKWEQLAKQWTSIQKRKNAIAEEEKLCREGLIQLTNGSSTIGHGLRLTKCLRKGRIDYDKIPELKKVNLEAFRSPPTESWRFSCERITK